MSESASASVELTPWSVLARFWFPISLVAVIAFSGAVWFQGAFNDRGYAPVQPIAFSHKQHAGDLKIDCKFCHFNAERGKHAGVPPMSVCMGCHSVVATDKPEIKRLTEIADSGTYTDENGVVREGGVVHWARVHKLPDHVYFSHQWHVKAGVACQTCHGPVEEMVRVRQVSDLTMKWCLDCHRKSNYVGGPGSKADDPTTWTVGTPDYAAMRDRQTPDPVVVFLKPGEHAPTAHAETATHQHAGTTAHQAAAPHAGKPADLPAWRRAALPDSHRLMNASTQCSTCHQ